LNKRISHIISITLSAVVLLASVSCSTQKAKWANIAFHNTTAHYNVWWNGNESLREGITKLEQSEPDDYTRILPPYRLGTKESAMAVYPELDRATEKGIKGIKKHSIFLKGREYVAYVRKCYLLTAQASFYKHDFVTAEGTCQVMINQYAGTAEADASAILKARCATAERRYAEAETELDALVVSLGKGTFDRSQATDLYMALLEALIPQEKYKKAVQFAKLALDAKPSRQQRARLNFILGQIYQSVGKRPVAVKYYEAALSKTGEYAMEFNARLNIASCADLEHANLPQLERQMERMLKDHKNDEYHDQIYYAMGEMYMGVKDAKKACDNFARSVTAAGRNPAQRARSALRLAGIQYELYENYDMAQRYYDTAMSVIGPDYPRYRELKSRYDILTSLVRYTRTIERNDSLLAFAALPASERDTLIARRIANLKAAEAAERERELIRQATVENAAARNTLQGDWYFYNTNTVQQGSQTFRQRWGTRALEDYWFLSKKGLLGTGSLIAGMETPPQPDGEASGESSDKDVADTAVLSSHGNPDDPHYPAYYLKDLPSTAQQRDSMHSETAIALLGAGYILYDGLKNTQRAVEHYLRMTTDYPDRDEVVQAFYMLYRIYTRMGNTPSADYYRNMVLMGFPDSDFANLIRDENYYRQLLQRDQILNEQYADLYDTYRRGRYRSVLALSREVSSTYPGHTALARFQFFEALALVQMDSTSQAEQLLEGIVATRSASDSIVPFARSLLQYLRDGGRGADNALQSESVADPLNLEQLAGRAAQQPLSQFNDVPGLTELSPEAQLFRYRENMQHYVVVLLNNKQIRATELRYQIANFNSRYYSNKGYKVNPLLFTDTIQMLTIHRFITAAEAMDYRTHLLRPESPLSQMDPAEYQVFPISTQNYATFYNRKNIEAYNEFFEHSYKSSSVKQ